MENIQSFRLLGVEARQTPCLTGAGAPTAAAVTGELYLDTITGDLYKGLNGQWKPVQSTVVVEGGSAAPTVLFDGGVSGSYTVTEEET